MRFQRLFFPLPKNKHVVEEESDDDEDAARDELSDVRIDAEPQQCLQSQEIRGERNHECRNKSSRIVHDSSR